MKPRTVFRRDTSNPPMRGGVRMRAPIEPGTDISNFMPFILLHDRETQGDDAPGFGDHPHSGLETMTYVLEGSLEHQDSQGGHGKLKAGDLQAMRAGRGIIHCESPQNDPTTNRTWGLQLWVAMPENNLNDPPGYTDVISEDCPVATPSEGVSVKIIAGESFGKTAPVLTRAPVWYLDITLAPGGNIHHPVPPRWNAFVNVLAGTPQIAGKRTQTHEAIFFSRDGDYVELENQSEMTARVLLIAGDTLGGQEVYHHGPFVSTSQAGIEKVMNDYRKKVNGFEGTRAWSSRLGISG